MLFRSVRPHRIVIDGFLMEVGEKLVAEGKEKTRAIIVEADGTWTPKVEQEIDSARTTPEAEDVLLNAETEMGPVLENGIQAGEAVLPAVLGRRLSSQPAAAATKRRQKIVIDLLDDD